MCTVIFMLLQHLEVELSSVLLLCLTEVFLSPFLVYFWQLRIRAEKSTFSRTIFILHQSLKVKSQISRKKSVMEFAEFDKCIKVKWNNSSQSDLRINNNEESRGQKEMTGLEDIRLFEGKKLKMIGHKKEKTTSKDVCPKLIGDD